MWISLPEESLTTWTHPASIMMKHDHESYPSLSFFFLLHFPSSFPDGGFQPLRGRFETTFLIKLNEYFYICTKKKKWNRRDTFFCTKYRLVRLVHPRLWFWRVCDFNRFRNIRRKVLCSWWSEGEGWWSLCQGRFPETHRNTLSHVDHDKPCFTTYAIITPPGCWKVTVLNCRVCGVRL